MLRIQGIENTLIRYKADGQVRMLHAGEKGWVEHTAVWFPQAES